MESPGAPAAGNVEAELEARAHELVEVNERLRRERLLSQLIIENAAEGIIVVDTQLRHLVWNAAMENVNGLKRGEVVGRTVFDVFPQFAGHPVGSAWRDAIAGKRVEMRDYRFFSAVRGGDIVYDADFTPLYDPDGGILGAICMLRETTERHRLEEALRRSQKLEAVAQLTGGVAHDFNNLLTAVVGCLEMIVREATDGRIVGLAETALRSAGRGAQLTAQLLAFARRQALRPVVADLGRLIEEIEILLRRAAGDSVELVLAKADGPAPVRVDPAQFEAAVLNLVVNARDAMPNGGRLVLETRTVSANQLPGDLELAPGDYVALAARDTGHGMSPEIAARAFEPFFTTKETGKGSGLGLSMVYGFARQSGGGVRLDSALGAGTAATIYLPRAAGPADAAAPARAPGVAAGGSGAILVVEDDPDVRAVSVAILEEEGYRVIVAGNGSEALAVLRRSGPIDLLFTDLVMPGGLSGTALAREARAMRPGLKVLLTTGYAGLDPPAAAEFVTLPKPFRSAELTRAVADLLAG